jgi:hypothetical protein
MSRGTGPVKANLDLGVCLELKLVEVLQRDFAIARVNPSDYDVAGAHALPVRWRLGMDSDFDAITEHCDLRIKPQG